MGPPGLAAALLAATMTALGSPGDQLRGSASWIGSAEPRIPKDLASQRFTGAATRDQPGDAVATRVPMAADARDVILAAAVCGGLAVALLTEGLSAARGLTRGWLLASWAVALIVGAFVAARLHIPRYSRARNRAPAALSGLDLAMLVWIVGVVGLKGAIAVFAVPITVDSMTYHLPRVAHWGQAGAVAFYPTHVIRQLHAPPWAEYAILHLFILWGGDRLANLVQWVSMVLSVVGVTVIARQLGAGVRGQVLSAFVCATLPMGVLQASTAQNDYAASLWLVCLVSALLSLSSAPGMLPVLFAGANLGLAVLTKGTSYLFAAPFLAVFVLADRTRPVSVRLRRMAVIVFGALALNAPHYVRNIEVFGSPLGPGGEDADHRYLNDAFWPSIVVSSAIRNLALHAGTPWPSVNARINALVVAAHRAMNIAVDDPRTTWPDTRFTVDPPVVHEDLAGNGLHAAVMAVAFVGAWRVPRRSRVRALAICLLAGFVLFCLLLRWQPWHSRLHLPLFVLAAPVVGVVLEGLRWPVLAIPLVLLGVSSAAFLAGNGAHPLDGRRSIFARSWAEQRPRHAGRMFVTAASMIRSSGCAHVGLGPLPDDQEYFLWALLADEAWRGRLEPVLVSNASACVRRAPDGLPCAIIRRSEPDDADARGVTIGRQAYRVASSRDGVDLLLPAR